MKKFLEELEEFYESVTYMSTRTETGNQQPLVSNYPYEETDQLSYNIAKSLEKSWSNPNIMLTLAKKIRRIIFIRADFFK